MKQDEQVTKVKFAWEIHKPCFGCKDFCPAKIEGTNYKAECKPGKSLLAFFPEEYDEKRNSVLGYFPSDGEHLYIELGYLSQCVPAENPEDYQWLKDFLEKHRGYKF